MLCKPQKEAKRTIELSTSETYCAKDVPAIIKTIHIISENATNQIQDFRLKLFKTRVHLWTCLPPIASFTSCPTEFTCPHFPFHLFFFFVLLCQVGRVDRHRTRQFKILNSNPGPGPPLARCRNYQPVRARYPSVCLSGWGGAPHRPSFKGSTRPVLARRPDHIQARPRPDPAEGPLLGPAWALPAEAPFT